jgi:hypothetical protein
LNLPHGSHAVLVDDSDLCADAIGVRRRALQANTQSGLRAAIVKEARGRAVLRHDEIEATVAVIVGVGGAALVAVDDEAGAHARHWRQSTLSVTKHEQAAT